MKKNLHLLVTASMALAGMMGSAGRRALGGIELPPIPRFPSGKTPPPPAGFSGGWKPGKRSGIWRPFSPKNRAA